MTDPKHNPARNPAVLIEVTRGPLVESTHFGVIAVADAEGNLIAWAGNPGLVTYYRSASKPIQTVPIIESGAADHFGLTDAEISLACGSHGGEDIHIETAQSILDKIGLKPEALACGTHTPYDKSAARTLTEHGKTPTVLHNNCSGKHAGMLALAQYHGWPIEGYQHESHPVQIAMRQVVADFASISPEDIITGIDGCSVVTFALPVHAMATSFARLAQPDFWPEPRRTAVTRIVSAMTAHPEMVAAQQERLDTDLMRAAGNSLIAKAGAEGVYCAARLPSPGKTPLGLALKLLDGDPLTRARNPAVIEALRQAEFLTEDALEKLEPYWMEEVRNRPGDVVGMVRPAFTLSAGSIQSRTP